MFALDHLHCWSRDPKAAARAYVEMFAAEQVVTIETSYGLRVVIRLAGQLLYIEQAPPDEAPPSRIGLEHFALATDAFDEAVMALRLTGARFLVEPKEARPGVRIAFVEAPDGGRVELVERSRIADQAPQSLGG